MLIFFFVFLFFFLLKVICSLKFQFCENFSKRQPVTEVNLYGAAHWFIRQMDPLSNKKFCFWCFSCPAPFPPVSWGPSSVTKSYILADNPAVGWLWPCNRKKWLSLQNIFEYTNVMHVLLSLKLDVIIWFSDILKHSLHDLAFAVNETELICTF